MNKLGSFHLQRQVVWYLLPPTYCAALAPAVLTTCSVLELGSYTEEQCINCTAQVKGTLVL